MHDYRSRYRRQRRSSLSQAGYVFPFLIFVCIGIILVLVFKLVMALVTPKVMQGAQMHIASGAAQLQIWGTESYFELKSDTTVMQGDKILTSADGRIIIEFFDGTLMRMDEGTEVLLSMVDEDDLEIEVELIKGQVWFNRVYKGTEDTEIIVNTDNLAVLAKDASVFSVSALFDGQGVRVHNSFDESAGVEVEILDAERSSVVEKERIGIAQQIFFSSDVLQSYWQFKSPTVLEGIDSEYRDSEWFEWNLMEDENPSDFSVNVGTENVGLVPAEEIELVPVEEDEEETVEEENSEEEVTEEPVEEDVVVSGEVSLPSDISVSGGTEVDANGFYVVTNNPAVVKGSISGAQKMVVNGYTLQKFSPGDGSFTYYANADFGLLVPGENTFEAYGIDSEGNKGESLLIKVIYSPKTEEAQEEVAEEVEESVSEEVPESI